MTQTLERDGLRFVCEDPLEVWRVQTIYDKEPGTVTWIRTFQPGDVFFDVGANIGIYTLLAAKQVGPTGKVFAIEPHLLNAAALLTNVQASDLSERVQIIATTASAKLGWEAFHYRSLERGSSGSQLGQAVLGGKRFTPCVTEWKYAIPLSSLLDFFGKRQHIKIDVDGHELPILYGLGEARNVVSVQVETEPDKRDELLSILGSIGFSSYATHFTANGQKAIEAGANPHRVICNTIFRRAI